MLHKCMKAIVIFIATVAIVYILTHLKEISELSNKENSTFYFVKAPHCGTFSVIRYLCYSIGSITKLRNVVPQPTVSESALTEIPMAPITATTIKLIRPSSNVDKSDADVKAGMAILRATNCAKSVAERLSYGDDVELSEFPWMALLVYTDGFSRTFECGGSLITDRYVLTAAHCIRVKKRLASVRLGEFDINEDPDCIVRRRIRVCAPPVQEIDVEKAVYHKGHNRARAINDIGLIRLISKVIFDISVIPICLPVITTLQRADISTMIIAGWGIIETGLRASILQKAEVPVRSNEYCQSIHKLVQFSDKHLCAGGGENKTNACAGDSGSPMFYLTSYETEFESVVGYIQYGIVTHGGFQCGSEHPGIFTRVAPHLQWIAANISS